MITYRYSYIAISSIGWMNSNFVVRLGSRIFELKVVPMGWNLSCFIAQSIAWAILAFRKTGEDSLGLPSLTELEAPPAMVLLERNKGAIFLLYDSFLIIADPDTAKAWQQRILRNCAEDAFNVKLKYITLEPSDSCNFVFAGMEISKDRNGIYWRPDQKVLAQWRELATESLKSTPRTLWKLLGYVRFAANIVNTPRRKLGRYSKTQSQCGLVNDFDEVRNELKETIVALQNFTRSTDLQNKCHAKSHIKRDRDDPLFLVVDATPERWVVSVWRDRAYGGNIFEDVANSALPTGTKIDEAEAIPLAFAITWGRQFSNTLIIGSDNTGVGLAFHKGFSHAPEVDREIAHARICELDETIILVDIPTDENFADIGTRPGVVHTESEFSQRTLDSKHRLDEAYKKWKAECRFYFSRKDIDSRLKHVKEENLDVKTR